MKRFRDVGALLGLVVAVAGCDRAPDANALPGGGEPASSGAARAPTTATAGAVSTGAATPSAPSVPQTSKWGLDPENSSVQFVCKHVFTNVRGMLPKPSGTVTLDEATPANSRVEVTVDVGSITTGVEER